jgi:hypothetical protein
MLMAVSLQAGDMVFETTMGRISAAIEDEGGGFKDEALFRLERIDQDINKLAYSTETRWNAHYLYAKVSLETKDRKKAARVIALAQQGGQSLDADKQTQTNQLAQQIQNTSRARKCDSADFRIPDSIRIHQR